MKFKSIRSTSEKFECQTSLAGRQKSPGKFKCDPAEVKA